MLLARAARALDVAGERVDLVSDHHPVASVLCGCARELHEFLGRADSLGRDYPPEVVALLNEARTKPLPGKIELAQEECDYWVPLNSVRRC
ncbi:hypothetical protein ACQPYE_26460 [Actinosynnema sp. CA-299493]